MQTGLLLTHLFPFVSKLYTRHFEFKQILNTDLQQAAHEESYICMCVRVCKKVSLFIHFFQPNQNGLSANKFNSMLYQLHFKPVQMFCFRFPVTIQLNLYYM